MEDGNWMMVVVLDCEKEETIKSVIVRKTYKWGAKTLAWLQIYAYNFELRKNIINRDKRIVWENKEWQKFNCLN